MPLLYHHRTIRFAVMLIISHHCALVAMASPVTDSGIDTTTEENVISSTTAAPLHLHIVPHTLSRCSTPDFDTLTTEPKTFWTKSINSSHFDSTMRCPRAEMIAILEISCDGSYLLVCEIDPTATVEEAWYDYVSDLRTGQSQLAEINTTETSFNISTNTTATSKPTTLSYTMDTATIQIVYDEQVYVPEGPVHAHIVGILVMSIFGVLVFLYALLGCINTKGVPTPMKSLAEIIALKVGPSEAELSDIGQISRADSVNSGRTTVTILNDPGVYKQPASVESKLRRDDELKPAKKAALKTNQVKLTQFYNEKYGGIPDIIKDLHFLKSIYVNKSTMTRKIGRYDELKPAMPRALSRTADKRNAAYEQSLDKLMDNITQDKADDLAMTRQKYINDRVQLVLAPTKNKIFHV